ncbi:MAG: hypothetical protein J5986_12015 [Roseburia sp.]|nr:hypothetical protein [Roseburia sp.]
MSSSIVLATSIAPKGIENQQRAVASWIKNGFRVISCNVREEIEMIAGSFPEVEFVEVKRDSREINGKPCPYIYDMLQVLRERGTEICGIVNSDIHLKYFSQEMYEYLHEQAQENLVFLRRQEVLGLDKKDEINGVTFFGGIDTFFFHKKMIDLIEDDGLILGQAMWDYWFPIVLEEKGIKLREMVNPITFHVTHATRWDDSLTEGISYEICEKHFPEIKREDAVEYLKDRFFSIISSPEGQICFVPEELKVKRILVRGEKLDEENRKRLQNSRLDVTVWQEGTEEAEDFDYVIEIPYQTEVSVVFAEAAVWIMEMRNLVKQQVPVYWRGNRSGDVIIENCNTLLRQKFNREIKPIVIWRKNEPLQKVEVQTGNCPVCIATVWIEEDETVIWNREKTVGRVLIFPAGFIARKWVKRYRPVAKEIELVGWVDNNPDLQDTDIFGMKVFRPDEILGKQNAYDKIFIISNLYAEEIYQSLSEYVPKEKLVIWNEYDGKKWRDMQR